MSKRPLIHVTVALVMAVVIFILAQDPMRAFEVDIVVRALQPLMPDSLIAAGTNIVVSPSDDLPFLAEVRPSCSSAGAIIALAVLGFLIERQSRWKATAAAMAVIFIGNFIRIAASLGVGVAYGKSSLILFHDAAGGAFTFLYIILGFATYLWFTLPAESC